MSINNTRPKSRNVVNFVIHRIKLPADKRVWWRKWATDRLYINNELQRHMLPPALPDTQLEHDT